MTPDKPLSKWTVSELKAELKARALPQTGVKAELIERLEKVMGETEVKADVVEETENQEEGAPEEDAMQEDKPAEEQVEANGVEVVDHPAEQVEAAKEDGNAAEAVAEEAKSVEAAPQEEETPAEVQYGPEEWETMDIPESWIPLPILKFKNLPQVTTTEEIEHLLTEAGLSVKCIVFEEGTKESESKVAYVRLAPPKLPWKQTGEEVTKVEAPAVCTSEQPAEAAEQQPDDTTKAEAAGESEVGASTDQTGEAPKAVKPEPHTEDDGRLDGDVAKFSKYAARRIIDHRPELSLHGQPVVVEAPFVQCTLFLGNVVDDDDEKLKQDMEKYGEVVRCFILRNPQGQSKGYGFVEYHIPAVAAKAREALDLEFNSAFSGQRRPRPVGDKPTEPAPEVQQKQVEEGVAGASTDAVMEAKTEEDGVESEVKEAKTDVQETDANQKSETDTTEVKEPDQQSQVEKTEEQAAVKADDTQSAEDTTKVTEDNQRRQIKILRAEFANTRTVPSLFARNLYVANLKQGFYDEQALQVAFEQYGPVTSCSIAKNMAGHPKGFAFVEFKRSDHADAALRAFDGGEHSTLGKILVSFVNPSKTGEKRSSAPMKPQMYGRGFGRGGAGRSYPERGGRYGTYGGRGMPPPRYMGMGYPGRGNPAGRGFGAARGMPYSPDRGYGPARGAMGPRGGVPYGVPPPPMQMQRAQMQMQAQMQAQMRQQMQMQAAMRAQTLQAQQQLAAMRAQLQTAQQQALKAQQDAAAAVAAARARQSLDSEATRKRPELPGAGAAAASQKQPYSQQGYNYGNGQSGAAGYSSYNQSYGSGYGSGYNQQSSSYGSQQAGGGYNSAAYGSTQAYGAQQSSGYGAQQQSQSGYGYQAGSTAPASYGTSSQQTYGSAPAAYGSSQSGYGSQSGYSAAGTQAAAAANYSSSTGYGTAGAASGYASAAGAASGAAAGYATSSYQGGYPAAQPGQKRDAEYGYGQQSTYQAGYGGGGYTAPGQDYKRPRY